VIRDFRHKGLEWFFTTGSKRGILPSHAKTALDNARSADDMSASGWKLHKLQGKLGSFHAVTVNGNWRLIFRFDGTDVFDVDYVDYH